MPIIPLPIQLPLPFDGPTKVCSKCKLPKPITGFSKSRIHKDGLYSSCKDCKRICQARYLAANQGKVRSYAASYLAANHDRLRLWHAAYNAAPANKERKRLWNARYYAEHKEQICKRTSATQKANKTRYNAYTKKYRTRHRERYLASLKRTIQKWRAQNRDKDRAASLRWTRMHPEHASVIRQRRRVRAYNAEGSFTAEEWQTVKQTQGYRCLRCQQQEPEIVLTVDHVIPLSKGGSNFISNIQGLCKPCNSAKYVSTTDYRS